MISFPVPSASFIQALKKKLHHEHRQLCASFEKSAYACMDANENNVQCEQPIHFSRPSIQPKTWLKQHSDLVDSILKTLWKKSHLPPTISLIATGGYGRKELFPYSDIDVLILLPTTAAPTLLGQLELLIQHFWDLNITFGHSISTLEETIAASLHDITIQTSLLDARLIIGNQTLFSALQNKLIATLNPRDFFQTKLLELRQRHIKYEDTPYSLEPNCKESPGALRDLQVIVWIAKAAQLGDSWSQMVHHQLITATEAKQLKRVERAFQDMRIRLHIYTGHNENRLLFDLQTPIALTLGLSTTSYRRASEYLMQRYYWAAKTVTLLNTILLQNIETYLFSYPTPPQPIHQEFKAINGFIEPVNIGLFTSRPSAIFELFLLISKKQMKGMTPSTMRALWHARTQINASFRNNIVNQQLFLAILQAPQGIVHTLRALNQFNLLGRYVPIFRRIVGQMQHDLYHIYTVDQHILMTIRHLRRFTIPEYAHEYPLCSELSAQFPDFWILYVAALFHDIGKGQKKDHSLLGAQYAKRFCLQHKLSSEQSELIVFLVRHHLLMSHVAQKQDLSHPSVIHDFVHIIENERKLIALYLLTIADIRATSHKVWSAWKHKLLTDLFYITQGALKNRLPDAHQQLNHVQKEALVAFKHYALPDDAHTKLWAQLDMAYFLRHDAKDIAWHTAVLFNKVDHTTPIVTCQFITEVDSVEVLVYTKDQPDLFARMCSYFDRKVMSILDARIHTTLHGYALDTFLVSLPHLSDTLTEAIILIEKELQAFLLLHDPLPVPNKGRLSRLSRAFPLAPMIDLRPDESKKYYILHITANDRIGLLYAIAKIFANYGIHLQTAKISTLGERVEDVFLLEGNILQDTSTQIRLETDLLQVLTIA